MPVCGRDRVCGAAGGEGGRVMGYNTKIDWCDTTWNPVTGCYHDCAYCYARGIANRFGGYNIDPVGDSVTIYDARAEKQILEQLLHPPAVSTAADS